MVKQTRRKRVTRAVFTAAACIAGTLFASGCAIGSRPEPGAQPAASLAGLRQLVQEQLDAFRASVGAPGATAAFVLPGGRGTAVASGVSNRSSLKDMRPTDRMLAGSVGKTFVAAVLLQLFEEGRVDLDDRISRWFGHAEWFPRLPNAQDITLRMLMNHTSGIAEYIAQPGFMTAIAANPQQEWTPEERIAYALDQEPLFPAGQGWSYADTNYILVGMIIERVTGRTYYQELTDRMLRPLSFHDTVPSDRNPLPGLVCGYTSPQNPFPIAEETVTDSRCAINPQMEWTGGGVLSTSADLARWARLLYAGDVLKDETKAMMLQGTPTQRWPDTDYGLGVIIRHTRHGLAVGHGGWFPGFVSIMGYYPDLDVALAVQVNSDIGMSSTVLSAFLDELAGGFAGDR